MYSCFIQFLFHFHELCIQFCELTYVYILSFVCILFNILKDYSCYAWVKLMILKFYICYVRYSSRMLDYFHYCLLNILSFIVIYVYTRVFLCVCMSFLSALHDICLISQGLHVICSKILTFYLYDVQLLEECSLKIVDFSNLFQL